MGDVHALDELSPIELAFGRPIGPYRDAPPLPAAARDDTMLAGLEAAILPGLLRPPCIVTFSGGRDSSGLLAVATALARRENLDLPIPLTFRYPQVDGADESSWQQEVIRWLKLHDWIRIDIRDEHDMVGPLAASVLRRHGLLWPFNSFIQDDVLRRAGGGSVVSGGFGDEVLGQDPWLVRRRLILTGKLRPNRRDLMRIPIGVIPPRIRAAIDRVRGYPAESLPNWLTPHGRAVVVKGLASDRSRKPLSFRREVAWWWARRYAHVGTRSLQRLADDHDALVLAPYASERFLAVFARAGKWFGFRNRTQVMRIVFTGVLPDALIERSSKAVFNGVFWNRHTAHFLERWQGEGLDPAVVDVEKLRSTWLERPGDAMGRDFRSAMLLQAAWLATDSR